MKNRKDNLETEGARKARGGGGAAARGGTKVQ